jgi:copper chaperone CopZ
MKKNIRKAIGLVLIFMSLQLVSSCGEESKTAEIKEVEDTKIVNGKGESTFTVWGNCEMCKETIENSLKIDGIESANWNVDKKLMHVQFDATKIDLDKIQKTIALAGYDNVKYKGDDKAYKKLHACCQYEHKK